MIIETQHGHKVEIREELMMKDHLALKKRSIALGAVAEGKSIDADAAIDLEEFLFRVYVISFDGIKETPYDKMIETLTGGEYEKVNMAIQDVVKKLGKE